MSFSDHFSRLAADYAAYRPNYPSRFFGWLAGQAKRRRLAWDCATGNGQAAVGLAEFFANVEATDASPEQIAHAIPRFGVRYRVAPADASGLQSGLVDLVTVAQALHWFDTPAFFAEARRVLGPRGVIAVWSYGLLTLHDDVLDEIVRRFHGETMGPYWPPERRLVDEGYRDLALPFEPIVAPPFAMEASWTLGQLGGYLSTWSAVQRARAATGADPVAAVVESLRPAWGREDEVRRVVWPLTLLVGRA